MFIPNWEKVLINPELAVVDAIKVIDAGSLQIVLVADEAKKLLGTVTDGDIRRGILRGIALTEPVSEVMRKDPVTAHINDDQEAILSTMRSRQIHQIPVVDDTGILHGLEILDALIQKEERENWVVIMAGGLGSRLMPLTNDRPKPLIKVGDKPVLENILENFTQYGFKNFYFAVNYKGEMIEDHFGDGSRWGVHIEYVREEQRLGTAGALALLEDRPHKTFIVMNGDILTKVNYRHLLDYHREQGCSATMCIREYDLQVPYGVIKIEDNKLETIEEKPVHRFFVNAGIYVMEPEVLDVIERDDALDMPALFTRMKTKGLTTAVFPIREYWIDIGRIDDLERAQGDLPAL